MSIIYDALKKAEKNINNPQPLTETGKISEDPKTRRKLYFIYALVVCLGIFIANFAFTYLTSSKNKSLISPKPHKIAKKENLSSPAQLTPTKAAPQSKPAPIKVKPASGSKRESTESLTLNGIFFSQNDGYALINNQIVKDGDTVDGAVVKKITADSVEVEYDGKTLKLYNR
jgi:type II secretory pathway component PulC